MKSKVVAAFVMTVVLCTVPLSRHFAQVPSGSSAAATLNLEQIVDRLTKHERDMMTLLARYNPMVETYLQLLDPHPELGAVPKEDKYFLGKLDFNNGITYSSLMPDTNFSKGVKGALTQFFKMRYLPEGFARTMIIDSKYFDRQNYDFRYVRREFLGEVRCLVFDVQPKLDSKQGTFWGRIWVEDQDYRIVRFNGTYATSSGRNLYFHFDSWRENIGPGLWLPAYIYTEESDKRYFFGKRKLALKGQTRVWGYNIARPNIADELTTLTVESDQVRDKLDMAESSSPVDSLRAWERQAEDNTLNRLQEAGLLAPPGEVNQILETVATNLEVTNDLNIQPSLRARVLLTSPLESFTVGHTIVLSRGLIDVLPDEASLATVIAHELAHIALGHKLDTRYAFGDRMLFPDIDAFQYLLVKRDPTEEQDADRKAAEILAKSPYKDKLGNAGLFLRAVEERAANLPSLLRPHLGNQFTHESKVRRMTGLMQSAPALEMKSLKQIAALPLGGRVRVDPWDNTTTLLKAKSITLLSAREKMPFEIAPVFLHLTRHKAAN